MALFQMMKAVRYVLTGAGGDPLRMRVVLYLFSVWSFLFCNPANASVGAVGEALKSALFRDCTEAKRVFRTISPTEEEDTYNYLVRVLSLNTEAPDVAEAFLPAPNAGHAGGFSWQSVDGRRELAAKRCALDLLESAGERAFPALLGLAAVYSEQQLSDELAIRIEEVSADIAERGHIAGRTLTRADVLSLINHLSDSHPLVAKNLLIEFFDVSRVELVRYLLAADSSDKIGVAAGPLLREVDPGRFFTMSAYLELAPSLNESDLRRGLVRIPLPEKSLLVQPISVREDDFSDRLCRLPSTVDSNRTDKPPARAFWVNQDSGQTSIVEEIAALAASPAPYLSQPFGKLLGQACLAIGSVSLSPAKAAGVAERRYLSLLSRDAMALEAQRCLVRSIAELKSDVRAKLFYGDDDETALGLDLLDSAIAHFNAKERISVFARIREISSTNSPLGLKALSVLTLFPERAEEVVRLYFQRAKFARGESTNEIALRRNLLLGLARPTFVPFTGRFASILTGWLRERDDAAAVIEVLEKQLPAFETALLGTWRSGSVEVRLRILELLAHAESRLSSRTLKIVSDAYTVPELRESVEKVYRIAAVTSKAELKSLRRDIAGANRFDSLRRLTEYGLATPREIAEFVALLSKATCPNLKASSFAIEGLLNDDSLPLAGKATLFPRMAFCLPEVDGGIGRRWAAQIPLGYVDPNSILSSPIAVDEDYAPVLMILLDGAVTNQETSWFSVIDKAILDGARASQTVALKILSKVKGDIPTSTVVAVTSLMSRLNEDDDNFTRAMLVLASLKNADYDWRAFVRSMIARCGETQLTPKNLNAVQKLPAQIVIDEVLTALESDDPNTIVGATRVGALLGKRGFSLVPVFWERRNNQSPKVRSAAVLALLEINPLTPDLHEYVSKLLVNRYYPMAINRPIEWQQTAAIAVINKGQIGFLRESRLMKLERGAVENDVDSGSIGSGNSRASNNER